MTGPHDRRRTTRPPGAFSLLELVLTLAIIATVSAIATPRYLYSADRYHTEAAARRIIADLGFARSEALQASLPITVTFDVANDRVILQGVPDPDHGTVPYTIDLDTDLYRTNIVNATFNAPGADAHHEVIFDIFGRPDSGGTVVFTSGASSRSVVLDAETGKASTP